MKKEAGKERILGGRIIQMPKDDRSRVLRIDYGEGGEDEPEIVEQVVEIEEEEE